MANHVGSGRMFTRLCFNKFVTIHWIAVFLLHNVVASELGPSEESIRQYLALYKQHQQRLKAVRPNEDYIQRQLLNRNVETLPQYYSAATPQRENWPSRGQEYYRGGPVNFPEWLRASQSQYEMRHDDQAIEKPSSSSSFFPRPQTAQLVDISRRPHDDKSTTVYNNQEDTKKEDKKSSQYTLGSRDNAAPNFMAHRQEDFETESKNPNPLADIYFVVIVAGCSAAAIFGVIGAGFCFYRIQKNSKAAAEVDYPAYGVTGPSKEHATSPSGDRRLAQSAQMYHYQHQKQQMIAVEKATTVRNASASDVDSEEENEEGDYTVYECPGLASTGEMEVKNPLFHDDSTPVSPPLTAKETTVQKP